MNIAAGKREKKCRVCSGRAICSVVIMLSSIGEQPRSQQATKTTALCSRCCRLWASLMRPEIREHVQAAIETLAERFKRLQDGRGERLTAKKQSAPKIDDGSRRIRLRADESKLVVEAVQYYKQVILHTEDGAECVASLQTVVQKIERK